VTCAFVTCDVLIASYRRLWLQRFRLTTILNWLSLTALLSVPEVLLTYIQHPSTKLSYMADCVRDSLHEWQIRWAQHWAVLLEFPGSLGTQAFLLVLTSYLPKMLTKVWAPKPHFTSLYPAISHCQYVTWWPNRTVRKSVWWVDCDNLTGSHAYPYPYFSTDSSPKWPIVCPVRLIHSPLYTPLL